MKKAGFLQDSAGNNSSSRLCMITGVFTMTAIMLYLTFSGQIDAGLLTVYAGAFTLSYGAGKITDDWKK